MVCFFICCHLIDEIQELCLCWVHAHGPHGVPQLPGVDAAAAVHVELVEGLLELGDLLLAHVPRGPGGVGHGRELGLSHPLTLQMEIISLCFWDFQFALFKFEGRRNIFYFFLLQIMSV